MDDDDDDDELPEIETKNEKPEEENELIGEPNDQFSQLPDEILVFIAQHLLPYHVRDLFALNAVNQRWHDVIQDSRVLGPLNEFGLTLRGFEAVLNRITTHPDNQFARLMDNTPVPLPETLVNAMPRDRMEDSLPGCK